MSQPELHEFDKSGPVPLDIAPTERKNFSVSNLSLFWRTFFLLGILLIGSIFAWLQTLRAMELKPRAEQTAQQLASLVNLSRAALIHSDSIGRVALLKTMSDEEGLRLMPREPSDKFELADMDTLSESAKAHLHEHLGKAAVLAKKVNGESGLWIGFDIDGDDYWLLADQTRFNPVGEKTWLTWLAVAAALSLAGAALIARRINRPLKELSFAASRLREGDFAASMLNEAVHTSEIREVNIGFNRMAQRLAKLEQDRAVMLAGISHDLRTPLARLRLETEMSVADAEARTHMAADIAQLDAIIDKFLDYARPDREQLASVRLAEVIDNISFSFKSRADIDLQMRLEDDLCVLADPVELGRILSNLLENARKYGKTPDSDITRIDVAAIARGPWVLVKIRDHGPGVAPEQLANLTKPFYRGEAARTAANGAGLGLAIVEKTVQRMGGAFTVSNSSSGGLAAHIKLRRAPGY